MTAPVSTRPRLPRAGTKRARSQTPVAICHAPIGAGVPPAQGSRHAAPIYHAKVSPSARMTRASCRNGAAARETPPARHRPEARETRRAPVVDGEMRSSSGEMSSSRRVWAALPGWHGDYPDQAALRYHGDPINGTPDHLGGPGRGVFGSERLRGALDHDAQLIHRCNLSAYMLS